MRLAIFGDSHAGRVKRTFDRTVKKSSEWTIAWFINRSMGNHPLRLIDTDGNESRLDDFLLVEDVAFQPKDYDLILCIGMSADTRQAMLLSRQFSHPKTGETAPRHLTAETWESALRDVYASTQAMRLLAALRATTREHTVLYSPPIRPMIWINTRAGHIKDWSTNLQVHGRPQAVSEIYKRVLEEMCREHDAHLIDQPETTIADYCWTLPQYGYGKYEDIDDEFWLKGDYFHANDRYAMTYIDYLRCLPSLAQLPSTYVWPELRE